MNVTIKRLCNKAIIPTYATDGAACFDLYAAEDKRIYGINDRVVVRTGLVFEIPQYWAMKIYSRSGHGFKHGLRLVNCVGVIDSDYRGEVLVGLHSDGHGAFDIKAGDRIAQAMLVPVARIAFIESENLTETARGIGGFGSTGV